MSNSSEIRAEIEAALQAAGLDVRVVPDPNDAETLDAAAMQMGQRREIQNAILRRRRLEDRVIHIAENAFLCWKKGDIRFYLHESPVAREHDKIKRRDPALARRLKLMDEFGRYNGYAHFSKQPGIENGYGGIYRYVQVHGGITFYEGYWDGSVIYGFDTAHLISQEMGPDVINDLGWLMTETEAMARGIQIAARFEPYYLRAGEDNAKKARVIDRMQQFVPLDIRNNTGVMLSLLGGEL